ncbi:MAG: Mrp/NBP35 family ATP-binding protein [Acidimicrobiaceae bacterium]|nr:Mrp/NBP35 family ATP-binding protein [Acidimicrobiaceae bacterium]
MSVSETDIREALRPVEDPELHRSIVELGMYRGASIENGVVGLHIALTVAGCPLRSEIQRRVVDAVGALDGITSVKVDFTVMTDTERAELRSKLRGHSSQATPAGTQQSAANAGRPAEGNSVPFSELGNRTRTLLVASGKGGVGKSSVTANLAIALAAKGKSTAVVDADVWGFSIPRMLGVDRPPVVIDDMIIPPEVHGVRCMSMGFFAREDQPVIWRGPMLHKALQQFLADVYWNDPDYLLVDLPPGTGDISLSLAQFLPRAEAYIVTTPNITAQKVAQRAAFMFQKVKIKVRGVIENMSWFTGDDGKRYHLFGSGGAAELAECLGVELVGQVPLSIELRAGGDHGQPAMVSSPDSEASVALTAIADWIEAQAPTRRTHPELKVL